MKALVVFVVMSVLKFERSNKVNLEQLANIYDILVVLFVSKFERSSEVNLEQPLNIYVISVT